MTKRILTVCMIMITISQTLVLADQGFLWTVRHEVVSLTKDETVLSSSQPEINEIGSEELESEMPPEEKTPMPSATPVIVETVPPISEPENNETGSEELESEMPPEEETPMPSATPVIEETVLPVSQPETNEIGSEELASEMLPEEENSL